MRAHVGLNDALLACGDSLINHTFGDGGADPAYQLKINQLYPPYSPILVNNGVGGQTSYGANSLMEGYLNSYPYCGLVTLAWGINDIAQGITVDEYRTAMTDLAGRVLRRRLVPIIPTIAYAVDYAAQIPAYNAVVEELYDIPGVVMGPDLYTLILDNPQYLAGDGLHFTQEGYTAAVAAWAESLQWAYDP